MEKRVLLAIFLSFLVLYVYQALFAPSVPPTGNKPAPPPTSAAAPPTTPTPDSKPATTEPKTPATPSATTLVGETSEREIRVETADVIATFTNRGGRLRSWRLKNYHDRTGQPVELVANDLGDSHPLPFSLKFAQDAGLTRTVNDAFYAVSGAPASDGPITSPAQLTFEYRDSDGVQVRKQFQVDPARYTISLDLSASQGEAPLAPAIDWGPGLGDKDGGAGRGAVAPRGLYAIADEVTRPAPGDVAERPTHQGDFQYVGVDDHYFMSVALAPGPSTVTYQAVTIPAPDSEDVPRQLMAYALEPSERDRSIRYYVGPKDFAVLEAVDRPLVRAIDFGVFAVIVVPLLKTLNWIYGFVGNYGWAIIVLTLIINVLMFPLRHKQVVSMRKMQEIQPEVKAIQDRYAKFKTTDPAKQKMNQELMALYRERGVNPAAGCLPMLLPLPVFFAFYALLYGAIELRGAPFIGWIHDLSSPDPLYITPILMVVTQVLQTWMMPAAGTDPMQQKMMLFMPIVLGFIFLSMPAGVVIYWVVNNIWGIGQQILTTRLIGPPNVRNPRPPAERRLKRVGSGKTDAAKE
jgi:YidC/Oxa1 family membrane protein insertase